MNVLVRFVSALLRALGEIKTTAYHRCALIKSQVYANYRMVSCSRLVTNQRGDMLGSVLDILIVFFVMGSIGITAIGWVSNSTKWTSAGVDADVSLIGYMLLPMLALVSIAVKIYRKTSGRR